MPRVTLHPASTAGARAMPARATVLPPGAGDTMHVLDGTTTFKVPGDATGGAVSLVELDIPHGGGAPPHVHDGADEVLYVLEGEFALQLDGRTALLTEGACATVPRGTVHGYVNQGAERGRLLSISTPAATPERMFFELAAGVASGMDGTPELSSALGQGAERRGMRLSGGFAVADDGEQGG